MKNVMGRLKKENGSAKALKASNEELKNVQDQTHFVLYTISSGEKDSQIEPITRSRDELHHNSCTVGYLRAIVGSSDIHLDWSIEENTKDASCAQDIL